MKLFRPLFLSLLATAFVAPLTAQPKPAPAVKTIEPARVAFINSSAFLDESTGIKQLVRVNQGLELEFSSTQSELSLLNEKLRTLIGELNKLNTDAVTNAKAIADKQTAGQKLQQEIAAKQQAAQEAYGKRAQEVQSPITTEIGKDLHAFAKERDIDILLDVAKLGDAVLDSKPEFDLTADFVRYYNTRHQ
jgi:Skp family chaperone for outer membrane proteins